MRIKSYFSGTVEAAMDLAGRELGDEALLLSARPAEPDVQHLGAYEVVVGVPDPQIPARSIDIPKIKTGDLGDFLRRMDCSPAVVDQALYSLRGREATDREVMDVLSRGVRFEVTSSEPSVIALIGPPGGGKTATLCKLAIQESRHRPVLIIDTDSQKVGAYQSLRRIAEIAGIEYQFAAQPEAVVPLLEHREPQSVFIDTPGFAPAFLGQADRWAQSLRRIPELISHLVLSATARTADLTLTLRRYAMFAPQRLIFTRLDECASAGGILSAVTDSGLPLSWFGTGQGIPDDVEPARADRIFRTLFEPPVTAMRQAAAAGGVR